MFIDNKTWLIRKETEARLESVLSRYGYLTVKNDAGGDFPANLAKTAKDFYGTENLPLRLHYVCDQVTPSCSVVGAMLIGDSGVLGR